MPLPVWLVPVAGASLAFVVVRWTIGHPRAQNVYLKSILPERSRLPRPPSVPDMQRVDGCRVPFIVHWNARWDPGQYPLAKIVPSLLPGYSIFLEKIDTDNMANERHVVRQLLAHIERTDLGPGEWNSAPWAVPFTYQRNLGFVFYAPPGERAVGCSYDNSDIWSVWVVSRTDVLNPLTRGT